MQEAGSPVVAGAGVTAAEATTTDTTTTEAKSRGWRGFYAAHVEDSTGAIFTHVERIIIATLIISAGAHVSSNEPAIVLFGYLRHSLVGRGVELFGIALLILNFVDGLYKLYRLQWHTVYQVLLCLCYFVLSVRLVQLILAFRGE